MSGFGPTAAHSRSSGPASGGSEAWRQNLITDPQDIAKIAGQAKSVAIIGMKTKDKAFQPAYFVPEALARSGVNVIPVPVYYPEVQEILGKQVYRSLREIPANHHPLDIVDVFRRSIDVVAHTEDILAMMPKTVWLQSGIRNTQVEEELAHAGIKVVADRCLKVEREAAMSARL
eukprot:jgi/Astpho2/1371/e_gw1.00025.115.1_t